MSSNADYYQSCTFDGFKLLETHPILLPNVEGLCSALSIRQCIAHMYNLLNRVTLPFTCGPTKVVPDLGSSLFASSTTLLRKITFFKLVHVNFHGGQIVS